MANPNQPDIDNWPLTAKRIPDDVFAGMREKNLARWPTGAEIDLDEAAAAISRSLQAVGGGDDGGSLSTVQQCATVQSPSQMASSSMPQASVSQSMSLSAHRGGVQQTSGMHPKSGSHGRYQLMSWSNPLQSMG